MKRVQWIGWLSVFILTVLSQSATAESGASPVLFLELEMLQSAVVPEDQESNVLIRRLILELNMADTAVEKTTTPAGTLVLELNPLAELDTGDSSAGSYSPNVLVLELGALPEDIPEAELTTMLEDRSEMLILELDQMTADALEDIESGIASDTLESLILELDRIGTDPEASSDTLVLELDQLRDPRTLALSAYDPSLIGYWQLDEGSGNTARDYSGYHHDGTLYGDLSWSFDELEFGEGYIAIPDAAGLNPGHALTVSGWVYLDDVERDQMILGKLSEQGGYLLRVTGGQLCPIIRNSDGAAGDTGHWGSVPEAVWTHLAVTWQANGDMLGYIDGVKVGWIDAGAQPIQSNSAPLIFGADPLDPESAETTLEGLLADLRLYNVPLSVRAIEALAMGWRSQYWDEVDIDAWEGTDGTPGGAFSGSGGTPGMGPAADFELENIPKEFMISDGVLEMLEVEGMDKGIRQALDALKDQRFDDAASRHRFMKAVGEAVFTEYKEKLLPLPALFITDYMLKDETIPTEIREALKDLKKETFKDKAAFSNAVQKKLGEKIGEKVMDHAHVGQEFMITESALNKLPGVKDKLKKYKDKRFVNGNTFAKMMQLRLGKKEFKDSKLSEHAKVKKEFIFTQDVWGKLPEGFRNKLKNERGELEDKLKDAKFINEADFTTAVKDAAKIVAVTKNELKQVLKEADKKEVRISDSILKKMAKLNISKDILGNLEKLKGRSFDNEAAFSRAAKAVGVDFDSDGHQAMKTQVLTAAKVSASERRTRKTWLVAAKRSWAMRRIRFGIRRRRIRRN